MPAAIVARASIQQLIIELIRVSKSKGAEEHLTIPVNVTRAIAIIREPEAGSLSNRQIAQSVGASVADLNALFTAHVGMSLTQFRCASG